MCCHHTYIVNPLALCLPPPLQVRKQGLKESAAGDHLTAEEREQLEKNIKEQEKLMEGYQKVSNATRYTSQCVLHLTVAGNGFAGE